jgi:hypothetical protein
MLKTLIWSYWKTFCDIFDNKNCQKCDLNWVYLCKIDLYILLFHILINLILILMLMLMLMLILILINGSNVIIPKKWIRSFLNKETKTNWIW